MPTKLAPYAKAVAGFFVPFAGQVLAAMQDVSPGGATITQNEWVVALLTSLAAAGAVFGVPNKDPKAQHQAESVQPPEAGHGAVDLLITVLIVVILVVVLLRVL